MTYKCVYKVYIVNDSNSIKTSFLLMTHMRLEIYIKIKYNETNKTELKTKYFFVIDVCYRYNGIHVFRKRVLIAHYYN